MARKRLNIRFLVILLVILGVLSGLGYGVWKMNCHRIAQGLYARGISAYEAGDMVTATEYFNKFLASSEDATKRNDVYQKLALQQAKELDEMGPGSPQKLERIQRTMQRALEADPRNPVLKEAMAKAYVRMRKHAQAARLFEELVTEFPDKPEFLLEMANCFIAMDQLPEAGTALAKLVDTHRTFIKGFLSYANYHEINMGQEGTAEEILNNMVELNPQSAEAYAIRSIFRLDHKNPDGAAEDMNRAMELDPKAADSNVAAAIYAIYSKDFTKAHQYLDQALEADSSRVSEINRLKVRLADEEKNPDDAVAILRSEAESRNDIALRLQLFERLIAMKRLDDAKKEVTYLRKLRLPAEIIGFFESTIDILEGHWKDAMRKLELARAALSMHPPMLAYIDRQLALCYGEMGQTDKQLEAFARAIENASEVDILPFYTAYILVLNNHNRQTLLETVIQELIGRVGEKKFMENPQLRAIRVALMTQKEAALPKNQQNWDAIAQILEGGNLDDSDPEVILLGVRMLIKQDKIDDARALLERAIKESPDTLAFSSYYALMEAQERNYDKALEIVDEVLKKKLVSGIMLAKIRILLQMGQYSPEAVTNETITDEGKEKVAETIEAPAEEIVPAEKRPYLPKVKEELITLEKQSSEMPLEARETVQKQLALTWMNLDDLDNARRILNALIQESPDNLGLKVQMFDLARKAADEKGMDEQLEGIQKVMGNSSAEYLYCQAAKMIWLFNEKRLGKIELHQARDYLNRAQALRPNWVNIPRAVAEIALLEEDYGTAIEHLYRVDQLGALSVQQINLLIRLLYREERDIEVKQLIENKRGAQLASDVAMISVESLINAGDGNEAIRRAREIAANDPSDQLWKGHIALRAKNYKEAESIFRIVTERSPENPNGWLSLLQVLRIQGIGINQEEYLQKIRESVEKDKMQLCLARAYQLFGDAREAEATFRQAVAADPDSVDVLYAVSQFYMCTSHPELAVPYLQKMSERIGTDRKIALDVRNLQLAWTRRSLAQVYGKTSDYDKQQEAIQLVDANLRVYPDSLEDLKIKALLLAGRGNPVDNQAAIEILENIPSLGELEQFTLAKLYDIQSSSYDSRLLWDKCQMIMRDLINANDSKREYIESFVEMLLRQKVDVSEITPYLERLRTLAAGSVTTRLLIAKTMVLAGEDEQAKKVLWDLATDAATAVNEEPLRETAAYMERLGMTKSADAVWENLIKLNTKNALGKTKFLARTEGITLALDVLDKNLLGLTKNEVLSILPNIFQICDKPGSPDELIRVEKIARSVTKPQDDPMEYEFFVGQFLESQGKVQEAIQKYEELLRAPSISKVQKGYVLNNLAYLLAVSGTDITKAKLFINEATETLGKGADLLDTRATIYLRSTDPHDIDMAIEDLKRAIVVKHDALYYFHMAFAYMRKDNRNSAKIAFTQAKRYDPHLSQNLWKLERKDYESIAQPLSK